MFLAAKKLSLKKTLVMAFAVTAGMYIPAAYAQEKPVAKKFPFSSGVYGTLNLAYNPQNGWITAIYEDYVGWNEHVQAPQFSCYLYIEGKWLGDSAIVNTYMPFDTVDNIKGVLGIMKDKYIYIIIEDAHGGSCIFSGPKESAGGYSLDQPRNWLEIRGIAAKRACFYTKPDEKTKLKQYVVNGDVVYIDKIEPGWVHCTYMKNHDAVAASGWIKSATLHKIY